MFSFRNATKARGLIRKKILKAASATLALISAVVTTPVSRACETCTTENLDITVEFRFNAFDFSPFIFGKLTWLIGSHSGSSGEDIDGNPALEYNDVIKDMKFKAQVSSSSFPIKFQFSQVWSDVIQWGTAGDYFSISFIVPSCHQKFTIDGKELDWGDPAKHFIELGKDPFVGWAALYPGEEAGTFGVYIMAGPDITLADQPQDVEISLNVSLDANEDGSTLGDGGELATGTDASGAAAPFSTLDLGPAQNGNRSDQILWRPTQPNKAAKMDSLIIPSVNNSDFNVVVHNTNHKQVYNQGHGLVDIVTSSTTMTISSFVTTSTIAVNGQGVYTPSESATKTLTITQQAPNQYEYEVTESGQILQHLTVIQTITGSSQQLTQIDHLKELKREVTDSFPLAATHANRSRSFDTATSPESLLSDVKSEYQKIDNEWILVAKTIDPDGQSLITSWNTDENGKITSATYPDGYWEKFEYIGNSITKTWTPFKDSPATPDLATDTNCKLVTNFSGTVTTSILGQTVLLETTTTSQTTISGTSISVETSTISPSGGPSLTSITKTLVDPGDSRLNGRIHSQEFPDGRVQSFYYSYGDFDANTLAFTPNPTGSYLQTSKIEGTTANPDGIPNRTLKTTDIEDQSGSVLLTGEAVFTGSGNFEPITQKQHVYDNSGNTILTKSNGQTVFEAFYEGDLLSWERDLYGTKTEYTYDSTRKLQNRTIASIPVYTGSNYTLSALLPMKTSFEYDKLDRTVRETQGDGDLTVTELSKFNVAGNLAETEVEDGLKTVFTSSNGGRTTITTLPTGATIIEEHYKDRSLKSRTGTGVVHTFYDYGVWTGSDSGRTPGTTWTKTILGTGTSNRWTMETSDGSGRLLRSELPQKDNTTYAQNYHYDARGLQEKIVIEPSGGPGTQFFEYDELGNISRRGLDMDYSDTLTLLSPDRIFEYTQSYEKVNSDWWKVEGQKEYFSEADVNPTQVLTTRKKLSGLAAGQISQTEIIDVLDRRTITKEFVDRTNSHHHIEVDAFGSIHASNQHYRNGLLQRSNTSNITKSTIFTYDGLGREIMRVEPRADLLVVTTYTPNSQNIESITRGGADEIGYEYYSSSEGVNSGGLKAIENNGLKTHYSWNLLGQTHRIWGTSYPQEYEYDQYGDLQNLKTFRSQTNVNYNSWPTTNQNTTSLTTWVRDEAHGNLIEKIDASQHSTTISYDFWHRPSSRTWARGITTIYSYDPASEIVGIFHSDATPPVTISFNRRGLRSQMTDASGARTFTYTPDGQLKTDTSGFGAWTIGREHYPSSTNLQTNKVTKGKLREINISGTGLASPGVNISTFYYSNSGLLQFQTINGESIFYDYDANSTFIKTTQFGSADVTHEVHRNDIGIATYLWTYGGGIPIEETIALDQQLRPSAISYYDGRHWQLSYNGRSEIKEAIFSLSNTPLPPYDSYQYLYDDIGNRRESLINSAITSYTSNNLNQYAVIQPPGGSQSLSYDLDGNLTNDEKWIYTWDAENRLSSITSATLNFAAIHATFQYDADHRRISKTIYNWNGTSFNTTGQTTWFLYDKHNLVAEFSLSGTMPTLAKRYYWGPDKHGQLTGTLSNAAGGIGGLLRMDDLQTSSSYHFISDRMGNISTVLDANAGLTDFAAEYIYDPFGNRIYYNSNFGLSTNFNPFQFSTKYLDSETGLYYYGYRYYSPELGRWLNRDPIGESGGVNLYAFVLNRPLNSIDPLGLLTDVWIGCFRVKEAGSLFSHCDIIATCSKTNETLKFSIKGPKQSSYEKLMGGHNPRWEKPEPPKLERYESKYDTACDDSDCCNVLECLKKKHKSNRKILLPYYAASQNSNTYANSLLQSCGCKFKPFDSQAYTAPMSPTEAPFPMTIPIIAPPGAIGW